MSNSLLAKKFGVWTRPRFILFPSRWFSPEWAVLVNVRREMAEGIYFVCGNCRQEIRAWDEGNPYFINERGEKQYAYHPHLDRGRCIGNDAPHLCLSCGKEFVVDSNAPRVACPVCQSENIAPTFAIEGKRCPNCKGGAFARDPSRQDIS